MSRIRRRVENEFTRKADQQWDLAGLARQDGDTIAEQKHTALAREYERQAMESIAEPQDPHFGNDPLLDDDW